MKLKHGLLCGLLAMSGAAFANVPAHIDAPVPLYVDSEASAVVVMPIPDPTARTLQITLVFGATPTNNAEIALGTFGEGSPDPDATALTVGFDCGEWFIVGDRLCQTFSATAANPTAVGTRTLTIRVRLDPSGAPVGVAFMADGVPVTFEGLEPETLLSWLVPRDWDTLQVTSRGGAQNVSAEVKYIADGTTLIVR